MKYERWLIPETDDAAVEALMDAGYPYLVSTVLASRGVVTPEQAAAHLDRERSLVYSPFLMRDMDKAVARIDRALAGGETIAVFGDYDVDGITSTCLLTDYLRSRGADGAHAHSPAGIEEGYGLELRRHPRSSPRRASRLIVTVDCGITGAGGGRALPPPSASTLVITDHHECKDALPAACRRGRPPPPGLRLIRSSILPASASRSSWSLALGGAERESALCSPLLRPLPPSAPLPTSCAWRAKTAPSSNAALRASTAATSAGPARAAARGRPDRTSGLLRAAIGYRPRPPHQRRRTHGPRGAGRRAPAHAGPRQGRAARPRAVRPQPRAPERRAGYLPLRHRADGHPAPPPSATRSCSRARTGIRAWSASSPRAFPKNSPVPAS